MPINTICFNNVENFIQQICIGNKIYKCFNKLCALNNQNINLENINKSVCCVFNKNSNGQKYIQKISIKLNINNNNNNLEKHKYEFKNYQDLFNFLYSKNNLICYGANNFYNIIDDFLLQKNNKNYLTLVKKNLILNKKEKISTQKIVSFFYKFNNYINNKTDKINLVKYNNGIEKIIEKVFKKTNNIIKIKFSKNFIVKQTLFYLLKFSKIIFLFCVLFLINTLKYIYLFIEAIINTFVIVFISVKNIVLPYFYNFIICYVNCKLENFYLLI